LRGLIASVVLGYRRGAFVYQYEPQYGELILYNLISRGFGLDQYYVAFQALQAFNNQVAVDQAIDLANEAQKLYEELLPTLGSDFLSQFDELELLLFYLQALDNNIEPSLEQF
jgi:hypothetical protein